MIKNKHFPQLLKKYRMLIGVVCFILCYRVILSPLIIRWQELNDKILVLERKFKKVKEGYTCLAIFNSDWAIRGAEEAFNNGEVILTVIDIGGK